jgi:hypothetical protein
MAVLDFDCLQQTHKGKPDMPDKLGGQFQILEYTNVHLRTLFG